MAALSVHKIGAGNKTSIPLFEAALVSVSLNVELEATPPAIAIVFTFSFYMLIKHYPLIHQLLLVGMMLQHQPY